MGAGAGVQVVFSNGMGVESTATLLRWIYEPETRPCPLSELLVITSQTGNEYADTGRDVEKYILPLMREHGIRWVQVARAGASQEDGVAVLSDTRQPDRVYLEGRYRLADELLVNGTVPQYSGEHLCSLKYKAWVIETWLAANVYGRIRHAFGYNADEGDRIEKCLVAFGFNADETDRIERSAEYDSPRREAFFPLVEWGWSRADCIAYIRARLGVTWKKSCCVFCPFSCNAQGMAELASRHAEHPAQVAEAMVIERVALSLNPRGTLYRDASLIQLTVDSGNARAVELYEAELARSAWAAYRVRRVYGDVVHRGVEVVATGGRPEMSGLVEGLEGEPEVRRGIQYAYREMRDPSVFPAREEFYVAAPAVVNEKARYGMPWFESEWSRAKELQMLPRTAANLSPALRARISKSLKAEGVWKGRVWGRRAEITPSGLGFAFRVQVKKGDRKWVEGEASGVWPALDSIGAAEAPTKGETMKKKAATKTKKPATGKKSMVDRLKELRENPPKKRKSPAPAKKAEKQEKAAGQLAKFRRSLKARARRAVIKMPPVFAGEAPNPLALPDTDGSPEAQEFKRLVPSATNVAYNPAPDFGPVGEGNQKNFFGRRTTAVLLWMGKQGFNWREARAALDKFGGSASESTLKRFISAGAGAGIPGRNPADLPSDSAERLLAFLGGLRQNPAA